jgi:protoporphyrinogen oxidase
MWDAFHEEVVRYGGRVERHAEVVRLSHRDGTITSVTYRQLGRTFEVPAGQVLSTMPLRDLVQKLDPPAPPPVVAAASRLKYRDFITVALVVDAPDLFPDNWIYVHDPAVKLGRIQNFKNWSPEMVPDQSKTCLGLEYFCTVGDEIWSKSEPELIALATAELGAIGLVAPDKVEGGAIVHAPKAYPVYDEAYEAALSVIRPYIDGFDNLLTIGRNGTHTYNNQDHSMVMGMLAVRNLLGAQHDLWNLDGKDEYLEEVHEDGQASIDLRELAATQPLVPTPQFLTTAETGANTQTSTS